MKTRRFCPKCSRPLLKSQSKGYTFQCFCCDEDFYKFEVLRKKDLEYVKTLRKQTIFGKNKGEFVLHSVYKPYPRIKQRKRIIGINSIIEESKDKFSQELRKFMPIVQQRIISENVELGDLISRLNKEIEAIPSEPQNPSEEDIEQKGSRYDALKVYAHFFYAGCDWFILDWDRENEIVFCYAILNNDVEMSELGDAYLPDLTEDGRVELDFYWEVKSLAEALYEVYPDYFTQPKSK